MARIGRAAVNPLEARGRKRNQKAIAEAGAERIYCPRATEQWLADFDEKSGRRGCADEPACAGALRSDDA